MAFNHRGVGLSPNGVIRHRGMVKRHHARLITLSSQVRLLLPQQSSHVRCQSLRRMGDEKG